MPSDVTHSSLEPPLPSCSAASAKSVGTVRRYLFIPTLLCFGASSMFQILGRRKNTITHNHTLSRQGLCHVLAHPSCGRFRIPNTPLTSPIPTLQIRLLPHTRAHPSLSPSLSDRLTSQLGVVLFAKRKPFTHELSRHRALTINQSCYCRNWILNFNHSKLHPLAT